MESLSEILGDMLTTKGAAERLGVSIAKVHRLIASGALTPDTKLDGITGRYYFKASDVDALAERRAS